MASTGALTEASELQTAPRADSTLSSVSVMSLNRTTEKEGILVDVGFCDLEDPTFGDAAHRYTPMPVAALSIDCKLQVHQTKVWQE